jgi:hypothetical protein
MHAPYIKGKLRWCYISTRESINSALPPIAINKLKDRKLLNHYYIRHIINSERTTMISIAKTKQQHKEQRKSVLKHNFTAIG